MTHVLRWRYSQGLEGFKLKGSRLDEYAPIWSFSIPKVVPFSWRTFELGPKSRVAASVS